MQIQVPKAAADEEPSSDPPPQSSVAATEHLSPDMAALIERVAREMAQAMMNAKQPSWQPSPPPVKESQDGPSANPPQVTQVMPAASAPPPPTTSDAAPLVLAPAKATSPTPPNPNRINSSTHPAEHKEFGRFCESNPAANELKSAYMSDSEIACVDTCFELQNAVNRLVCLHEWTGKAAHLRCKLSPSLSKQGVAWVQISDSLIPGLV